MKLPAALSRRAQKRQPILYPHGIAYDLLAHHPALVEPFVQALLGYACSSSGVAPAGSEWGTTVLRNIQEKRVLYGLLIGQKMVQHEKLRSGLLLGASSPHSLVSALTQAAAAADMLNSSSVAAARQKLLSLQEIHFGVL